MFKVVLGEPGDYYDGGETTTLPEAVAIATAYIEKIKANKLSTHVHIVNPRGVRLFPPDFTE